jgi:hypothetical protein
MRAEHLVAVIIPAQTAHRQIQDFRDSPGGNRRRRQNPFDDF